MNIKTKSPQKEDLTYFELDIIFKQTLKAIKKLASWYFYTNKLTSDIDFYA